MLRALGFATLPNPSLAFTAGRSADGVHVALPLGKMK
jgi:hypothetical protein